MPRWAVDIVAGTAGFEAGVRRVGAATAGAAKQGNTAWISLGKTLATAGAAAAGAAVGIVALGQAQADLVNEITGAATRTGLQAETLAGLRLAAEGAGMQFSDLTEILGKLPAKFQDSEQGLRDTLKQLGAIQDPTQRAAKAIEIFGEQGAKLLVALGDPKALDVFVSQARLGVDVSEDGAAAAQAWQREMAGLKLAAQGAGGAIGEAFDGSAEVVRFFGAQVAWLGAFVSTAIQGLLDDFGAFGDAISGLADASSLGELVAGLRDIGLTGADAALGFEHLGLGLDAAQAAAQEYIDGQERIAAVSGRVAEGTAAIAAETEKAGKAAKEATGPMDDLWRVIMDATSDTRSETEALTLALQEQQEQIATWARGYAEGTSEVEAAKLALLAVEERYGRDVAALREREAEEQRELQEQQLEEAQAAAQLRIDLERQVADARVDVAGMAADAAVALTKAMVDQQGEALGRWEALAKAAALTQVVIDTAAAVMGVWRAYASIPFVGPALAAVGTAALVAVAGVEAGAIAGAYRGEDLDYARPTGETRTVHPGERILSRSEADDYRQGGRETWSETIIDGAPLARTWTRQVRRGGIAADEMRRRFGRLGHVE